MHILNSAWKQAVYLLMTVIKFYTFYKKQHEPTLCLTKNLMHMMRIVMEYMTCPSSDVIIHNFAK